MPNSIAQRYPTPSSCVAIQYAPAPIAPKIPIPKYEYAAFHAPPIHRQHRPQQHQHRRLTRQLRQESKPYQQAHMHRPDQPKQHQQSRSKEARSGAGSDTYDLTVIKNLSVPNSHVQRKQLRLAFHSVFNQKNLENVNIALR